MSDATGAQGTTTATGTEGQQAAGAAGQQGEQRQDGTETQGQQALDSGAQQGQEQQSQRYDTSGWPAEAREAYERQLSENAALRRERGDERINAKNAAREEGKSEAALAFAKALAPVLGIELPGEQAATPEQLTAQVASVTSERDAALKDAATVRAAMAAGVDPTKLDYLQFQLGRNRDYQGLALDAPDFDAKLAASISALVAQDSTLKLTGSAQASGVENLGGSGGADEITPEKFAAMSIQDRQDLYLNDKPTYDRLVSAAH